LGVALLVWTYLSWAHIETFSYRLDAAIRYISQSLDVTLFHELTRAFPSFVKFDLDSCSTFPAKISTGSASNISIPA